MFYSVLLNNSKNLCAIYTYIYIYTLDLYFIYLYSGALSGKLYNFEFPLKSQMLEVSFSLELCQADGALLVVCRTI